MKILVTGGAGFIGSHIADAFIAPRRCQSHVVLDNLSAGSAASTSQSKGRVYRRRYNGRRALPVRRLFREHRFEIVNHHAAQLDIRKKRAPDPVFDAQQNILGTLNLLEAAKENMGKGKNDLCLHRPEDAVPRNG